MNKYVIDLNADLLPGVSAAGIPLGISVEEVDSIESFEKQIIENAGFPPEQWGTKYSSESVVIWANSDKKIGQVMVRKHYQGKCNNVLGIGSLLKHVRTELGWEYECFNLDPLLFQDVKGEIIKGIGFDFDGEFVDGPINLIYIFPFDSV